MEKLSFDVKVQVPFRTVLSTLEEMVYTVTAEQLEDMDVTILRRIAAQVEKKLKEVERVIP